MEDRNAGGAGTASGPPMKGFVGGGQG